MAATASSGVELAAGELRLTLAPDVGGAIASFTRIWEQAGATRSVDWLRPATPAMLVQRNPLGMASFPLVPFCNRIRNGRARFEGREIRLAPNHPSDPSSPHPLHGIGWLRPWTVTRAGPDGAELALEVPASKAWPWRFSATQQFQLDADQLSVRMTITNLDDAAMPAGIGHHPYFPHTPGTRLTSPADAMWEADAEVMPTGLAVTDAVRSLREGVVLAELDLDNNFSGWEHHTRIDWPADARGPQRSLLMKAQSPLDYFVLYCPKGYEHFCAEPVSQCTDWLNLLPTYGPEPLGGTRLAPGETLAASFTLTPHWS